ncbi:unnamed protein product [Paramecium primaurelia]|uniref:Transmembrane protein n=1 Tax=Paramecium primaurelia TaxID=5886 RepID=A0A8S1PHQ2_PARPR|nr:unnamed protein product [Paramecium primaurelia]
MFLTQLRLWIYKNKKTLPQNTQLLIHAKVYQLWMMMDLNYLRVMLFLDTLLINISCMIFILKTHKKLPKQNVIQIGIIQAQNQFPNLCLNTQLDQK